MKINGKTYVKTGFFCLVLLSVFFIKLVKADDTEHESYSSDITIDWQEFQKILKLDTDEVKLSWVEFSKLLEQTGFRFKAEYKVDGGNVVLTREQFKNLIDKMKTPTVKRLSPPCDYLIRKASYNGVVGGEGTQFTALLELDIFRKDKESYLKIPLFREELAIEDIRFDGNPASIITDAGWHYLSTNEVGEHLLMVKFSVKTSKNKQTPALYFNIPQTPITHVRLDIPKVALDVTLVNAQSMEMKEIGKHTIVEAYIISSPTMSIGWKRKPMGIARGPAKIYAELYNLLSIEADAIRVSTKVKLNIIQDKLNSILVSIPQGYEILKVDGATKNIWNVTESDGEKFLNISFEYPIEGKQEFTIKSERLLPMETTVADFSGFEIMGTKRESGFVAAEVKSNAEAHIQEFQGLERIDFQKIPTELGELASRPILFSLKYVRHPYNIVVGIVKYEREEALNVIIDYMYGITLFQEDGKLVHQITFSIQNLWNQFIKLELPEDANIWSVYVDGKREKPSREKDGKILIPLVRSKREDGILKPFSVELIYSEPATRFTIFGKNESFLPVPNILINRLEWDFHLPANYRYLHFGGNLKKCDKKVRTMDKTSEVLTPEEPVKGEKILEIAKTPTSSKPKEKIGDVKKVDRGVSGLLSINVNIPISGENYLFCKKIIEKGEPLHLSFTYVDKRLIYLFVTIVILIILFVLFKMRKTLIPLLKILLGTLSKLSPLFKNISKPIVLSFILFAFLAVAVLFRMYVHHPIFLTLLILLFVASSIRLFKGKITRIFRFMLRPSICLLISIVILLLVYAGFVKIHSVRLFFPLFLLSFLFFLSSVIRLVISTLKQRKKRE